MRTFSIKTLGCKLNQHESARLARVLEEAGWVARPVGEHVDLALVNTCTVTDRSDRKCRGFIRQSARHSALGRAVVTGCLVNRDGEGVRRMPQVAATFDNRHEAALLHLSARLFPGDKARMHEAPVPAEEIAGARFSRTGGFIKIQDGCNAGCSYCIVPSVRGEPWSTSRKNIMEQARQLVSRDCPELILTGITIGAYRDGDADLADLIEEIVGIAGRFRIRLSSIEPGHVTEKLLDLLGHEKLCRHLHIPLQSGSDSVLERMRRPYGTAQFLRTVDRVRERHPEICIGTDMIVGFPGESNDDFEQSLTMIRRVGFGYVHQFSFSPRSGTPAAALPRCSPQETSLRARHLRQLAAQVGLAYRAGFVGRTLDCVVEFRPTHGRYTAVSDNYVKLSLEDSDLNVRCEGQIARARIDSASLEGTRGTLVQA